MRRRFQFSLTTLLTATAIVAVSVHWWALRQRAVIARQHFEDVKAKGPDATLDELREASNRVLQAELALPFTDERTAWQSEWERLTFMEMEVFVHSVMPSLEWRRKRERTRDAIVKEREAIGRRLGLPSD